MARLGGAVSYLIHEDFLKHHFRMFRLLIDKDFAHELSKEPLCMLGPFLQAFLQEYPDPDALQGDEASAVLLALAACLRLDTVPLECRFAFLRRLQRMASQTAIGPSAEN